MLLLLKGIHLYFCTGGTYSEGIPLLLTILFVFLTGRSSHEPPVFVFAGGSSQELAVVAPCRNQPLLIQHIVNRNHSTVDHSKS